MAPRLDRSEARRGDSASLDEAFADRRSCFVLFRGDSAYLQPGSLEPEVCGGDEVRALGASSDDAVLLGFDGEIPWLAIDLDGLATTPTEALSWDLVVPGQAEFVALRPLQEPVNDATWALLAQARALLAWNRGAHHCPACGAATFMRDGGHQRLCSNPDCGRTLFARTDPAIIVRVLYQDRCLLARQARFDPAVRSVLAGFVEPGESLENCVLREVGEEVGLEVDGIRYLGSQPWPFPMTLMVAFEAQAASSEIRVDTTELEAADWYTRARVLQDVESGALLLPSRKSISRRMIDGWLAGEAGI